MKEMYVSAYELAQITGKPLPQILHDIREGRIKTEVGRDWPPCMDDTGCRIPLSQFYHEAWNNL